MIYDIQISSIAYYVVKQHILSRPDTIIVIREQKADKPIHNYIQMRLISYKRSTY